MKEYKKNICQSFINLPQVKVITEGLNKKGKELDKVLKDLELELSKFTKQYVLNLPNYKSKIYGEVEEFNKL